jgi:acyl-CoA reductase-like NAD-dependent aldehyde dehydrogenase
MQQARFRLFIDGSYRDANSTFASIDPATGEPWAVMPAAGEDEVDAAVQAAHRALRSGPWAKRRSAVSGGSGREGGPDAIADYTRSKAVWIRTSDEPIPDPFIMR